MEIYGEIEKTFSVLEQSFSDKELIAFQNTTIHDLGLYHFGFGTQIRNRFLHQPGNVLCELFERNGITNADDMSSIMIALFHYHISRKKS